MGQMARRARPPGATGESLQARVDALWGLLRELYGPDQLVLKAAKVGAVRLMRSSHPVEQLTALQRLAEEDPTVRPPAPQQPEAVEAAVEQLERRITDRLARKRVEDRVRRRVAERMQQHQAQYVRELRSQVLREEAGPDNASTLRKFAELEKLEVRKLAAPLLAELRPSRLDQVVGQERAIRALLAKLASPTPQHVILYGPPGVGKTTIARLVLQYAKQLPFAPFAPEAPFVEVDGATLRWDPREVANPLLGSVHDPIFQGARRELADAGVPEPKPGLVTEAHGGVLFIDEIGEMDPLLQFKLLKVLEDKRVRFESAYYDPDDQRIPRYIRKLFEEGAPADFILLGATTRSPSDINPALRSRCAEVVFNPLTPSDIRAVVEGAADRIQARLQPGVADRIAAAAADGRKAVGILADAYSLALYEMLAHNPAQPGQGAAAQPTLPAVARGERPRVTVDLRHVQEALHIAHLPGDLRVCASPTPRVGRAFGLGAVGFRGVVMEVEAAAFATRSAGQGSIRFNEAAGSMARDSVFVAASLLRRLLDIDLADYDVHVNVVGGGRVDGPSAGIAILVALVSALTGLPVRQDVAMTGELSIWGDLKPVGGVFEKVWAAREAGMQNALVPVANLPELPEELRGHPATGVARAEEALDLALGGPAWRQGLRASGTPGAA